MLIEPFRSADAATRAAVLGRLWQVMTAGGAAAPDARHEETIRTIARHFLGAPDAAPGDAAAPLPPALHRPVAELALLVVLVDAVLDPRKVEDAARIGQALGVALPQVAVLRDAAAGRLSRLRLRVAGPLMRQLAGISVPTALLRVARTRLGFDRAHADRLRAAARLPDGTFGRELVRYYEHNPFELPGEKGGMPPILVGQHDFLHVLLGYDTSTEGELCVGGFVGGCGPVSRLEAVMTCVLQFNQGLPVQEFTKDVVKRGALRPETFFLALARGAACRADIADPAFDYMALLDRDLSELRAELGIGPEGMMVHEGQPRWSVPGDRDLLGGQKPRTRPIVA